MNIKIVICFIIIYFLPLASAGTWDDVRVARSSAFIDSNGSITFENYLIKAAVLDDTKASITVYRGQSKIETGDFSINDFKKYDSIGVTLLGIRGKSSWISISKIENIEIWRPLARKQLKWGETYTIENYTLNIDTYGSDSVNLTVSNKSIAKTDIFFTNGQKDYGTLRTVVTNINRTGFIDLDFFTDEPPDFKTQVVPFIKTEILTDKEEYFPDEPIQVSIKISSDFPLNIVGLLLETGQPIEILPDSFSATDLTGTQSFQSKITGQQANSTIGIKAKIEVRDYLYNAYVMNVTRDIKVTPEVAIIKSVQPDTDDETVPVQLYIYNSASDNRTIHIRDTIPPEFDAKELNWTMELMPRNSTTIEYNLTPHKPGLYFLPAATAEWNSQSTASRRLKMTMHMPYLTMKKTAVFNEGRTNVKLMSSNTGDRPAQVKIIDKIPDGLQTAGDTAWSGKLEVGESSTISYSLEGDIASLPAAGGTYLDIRGVTRQARSNSVDLRNDMQDKKEEANEETHEATHEETIPLNVLPDEMMSFMVSSFIVIAGIITGTALIAYLIIRYGGKNNG